MKKFTLLLAAVFVCSLASAQLVTTTSYTTVKRAKEKTVWYVKAGVTFANVGNFDEDQPSALDPSARLGYVVGIAFDMPLGHRGWFWNSGLQLATKGYKNDDEDYELKANKIELPVTFGYKIKATDDFSIDLRVGGYVNYDLWKTAGYSLTDEDEGDYISFSGGITGGIGVWYQKFNLNVSYQYGLVDLTYWWGSERNLMVSLGYAF